MDSYLPISWMEVLAHFPALEALNVIYSSETDYEPIFQAVNRIRSEDPSKLNLKHILVSFGDTRSANLITTLMDARLHLESLEDLCAHDADAELRFRDVLQAHAGTLKKLDFSNFSGVLAHDPPISQLKTLQDLTIKLPSDSMGALGFLQCTPNLRKLALHVYHLVDLDYFNLNQFPVMLASCAELEILDNDRGFTPENMKSLMRWTPNLKTFKVEWLDDDMFAMICGNWTSLVELHVGESEVTSSGILGWDEKALKRFKSLRRRRPSLRAAPSPWRPIMVPKANIASLKKLKILIMPAKKYHPLNLSRAVGLYGIRELPDLQRLRFDGYEISRDDRHYWKQLLNRYPCPVEEPPQ